MREDNLSGEDRVIVGDVGIRKSRTVLKFNLQAFAEIFRPNLNSFAANLVEDRTCFIVRNFNFCESAPVPDV
jgi:hypothetical protein